jgi:hypothetical protein
VTGGRLPVSGAERMRRFRERHRGTLPDGDPRHGTVNGYDNYGCRCEQCTGAGTEKVGNWRAKQ